MFWRQEKMITHILENTWTPSFISHGWGNGYVAIPKGHKLHGMHYDDISNEIDYTELPLTFSGGGDLFEWAPDDSWVVGFDTVHSFNDESDDMAYVADQTDKLRASIEAI